MNKFFLVITLIFLSSHLTHAQDGEFKMSGYVDAYYGYDFNKPVGNTEYKYSFPFDKTTVNWSGRHKLIKELNIVERH